MIDMEHKIAAVWSYNVNPKYGCEYLISYKDKFGNTYFDVGTFDSVNGEPWFVDAAGTLIVTPSYVYAIAEIGKPAAVAAGSDNE